MAVEVDDFGVSDVDGSLAKAVEHAAQLEQRARLLQAHFQQAKVGMGEISRLCDEADVSVRRSQSLLNRSAHRIHELNERAQHLLQDTSKGNLSYQAGGGSFAMPSPPGTLPVATPASAASASAKSPAMRLDPPTARMDDHREILHTGLGSEARPPPSSARIGRRSLR
eukprot:TRINITY_DN2938_c1_g2_i1.p1 TRINITY_DN2938_c1_g2~~TRINITY_DN2938_c1_g2_i1.p1  ORF type:complete len:182 (+),score=38.12 TRINITY_DN2938_c1_g2_i1:44-547(+)